MGRREEVGVSSAPIRYMAGDATRPERDGEAIIAHVCNDAGAWGCGFVLALSRRWSAPENQYRAWHRTAEGFELGAVRHVQVDDDLWVANLIGQHGLQHAGNVAPIRYEAITSGLSAVGDFALGRGASVHMPRMGCGLAGGTWDRVEPIISETLSARGVSVAVYDLQRFR